MTRARIFLALLATMCLLGCGGGSDPADDDRATTQPVDCHARPELCQ
jgi:hypothetical protein